MIKRLSRLMNVSGAHPSSPKFKTVTFCSNRPAGPNTYVLAKVLERYQGNEATIKTIKQVSPIAWQHIHVYGTYEFLNDEAKIDLDRDVTNVKINEWK